MKQDTNLFDYYATLGYDPLPIIPHDAEISERSSLHKRVGTKQDARGKTPGRKNSNGTWGSYDWINYQPDEIDYKRWHNMCAGIGLRTGNGLLAIDADTSDKTLAKKIKDIVEKHIGKPPVRVGNFPKALYVVRTKTQIPYQRVEFGPPAENGTNRKWRVEMLTEGRQFVAHGIHPKTLKPYEWVRSLPKFEELPEIDAQTIAFIFADLIEHMPDTGPLIREGGTSTVDQKALRGELEAIRKAVEATPNTSEHFPSRESYRDFGYAIKAALPDNEPEAYEIFLDWCLKWEEGDNDPDVVAADWSRMKPPFRIGAHKVYEAATELSDGKFSTAEVWFEDLEENQNPFDVVAQKEAKEHKAEAKRKFEFLDYRDVALAPAIPMNEPLIKGLLDRGTMSVMYGDSNAGKTFVAMDMAFHIAAGLPYAGKATTRGLVVYVAAEGGDGAKKRIKALHDKFPNHVEDVKMKLLASPVDLRRADADLEPLTKSFLSFDEPVGLVVIDTLSRAMAGGDENSPVDMGALVRNLDALRGAVPGMHLMIVHHTGKDRAKGARGHSLLRAATDTEFEVADRVVSVTKQRDLEGEWETAFVPEVRVLGMDVDGDPITSCTVRLDGGGAGRGREATPGEKAVLDAMTGLLEASEKGAAGVKPTDIAFCLAGESDNGKPITPSMVRAYLSKLKSKGLANVSANRLWSPAKITSNNGVFS